MRNMQKFDIILIFVPDETCRMIGGKRKLDVGADAWRWDDVVQFAATNLQLQLASFRRQGMTVWDSSSPDDGEKVTPIIVANKGIDIKLAAQVALQMLKEIDQIAKEKLEGKAP